MAPCSNPADAYAREVLSGRVPAGKYHRLACARHVADRARENTAGFPYRFVWEARDAKGKLSQQCAAHFFAVARKMKHYKGRQFAGQPFVPTPCQEFRLGSIFGWRHVDTGLRRFTTAYNEVPRKQGKSFEEAIVAVYVTFFEGEAGAEGYCLGTKEKQAKIAFNAAKRLVKSSGLADRIKVNAANLHREATESKLEPIGSDSDTTDGLNPHFIGVDELHAWKARGLLDVVESATGSRLNPLNFQITTAGNDLVSVCGDQHLYACKILEGVLEDDPSTLSFFAFIAHADEGDDWLSEDTWKKANPHWGVSVEPDDMRKLAAKAKAMPAAAAEFKQKRLNLWVNADQPWLDLNGWRKGQTTWDPLAMRGAKCYGALDLSSVLDLTAAVLTFPPDEGRKAWRYLVWLLTPADTLPQRAHRDRAPYQVWVDEKHLHTNPGNRIDQDAVRRYLNEMHELYDIQEIGFDPWNAGNLVQHLQEDGFSVVEVPQTYLRMSTPSKDFEADVIDGLVDTGGNPVMAWMASNVVVQRDGKDNIQPIKKRSRGRIDGIVACIIARGLATLQPERQPEYQTFAVGGR